VRNYYTTNPKTTKSSFCRTKQIRDRILSSQEANLRLANSKVVWGELKNSDSALKKHWAALLAARENVEKISERLLIVQFYNQVRTFFRDNY
jgi:hypothetical protein